jgi:YbgC/YbaW family acyl-CoA thioester hydrolase
MHEEFSLNRRPFSMPFKQTYRVRWVDTDLAGVMHFTNYLRYFEACEEEFYRSIALSFKEIHAKYGLMFPRVETYCSYKAACRFDDLFEVTMQLREVGEKTVTWGFQAVRTTDGKLAAEGYIKCIAVNAEWKAVPIPPELATIIRQRGR